MPAIVLAYAADQIDRQPGLAPFLHEFSALAPDACEVCAVHMDGARRHDRRWQPAQDAPSSSGARGVKALLFPIGLMSKRGQTVRTELELPPVTCLVPSWVEPYSGKPRRHEVAKRKRCVPAATLNWVECPIPRSSGKKCTASVSTARICAATHCVPSAPSGERVAILPRHRRTAGASVYLFATIFVSSIARGVSLASENK